jgi:peptide/nickel transport system permease protein
MIRYLSSRLAGMVVVLAIVAVLVFILTRAASGDPVSVLLGDQATAADIARVQKEYGLDKPLPVQFGYWLREVMQGNLGQSIFLQRPVTQALMERAEPTTLLALMAVAIAACSGGAWWTRSSPASRCWAPASRASGWASC